MMKGYLNRNQIDYVLFHLNLVIELTDELRSRFVFVKSNEDYSQISGRIIFILSEKVLIENEIKTIDQLPVLFPCGSSNKFWKIENNNLVFGDDIIKSSFYLLSGYQETVNKNRDLLGRFSVKDSIQYKLGVVQKPVVNYYFDEIKKGFMAFLCNQITLSERIWFKPFCFFLTHDVDRVRIFTINNLVFKFKELLRIKKSQAPRMVILKQLFTGLRAFILNKPNEDPAWDFEYLRGIEKKNRLKSAFYFLDDETKNADADYQFQHKRITNLIHNLYDQGCEIGIHGNNRSVTQQESLVNEINKLKKVFPIEFKGIRQHRLRYEIPQTLLIHQQCGFLYDTSLGFYDYEGFRNSFCLPFKLFDFENDKIAEIWEIPLIVMDCTLLEYRNLSLSDSMNRINELITEIARFSGVFTLLWHNGYFDEVRFPGIHQFYEDLIDMIMKKNPVNHTGLGIVNVINTDA